MCRYILPDLSTVDFTVLSSNNYLQFYTYHIKKHKLRPKNKSERKKYTKYKTPEINQKNCINNIGC